MMEFAIGRASIAEISCQPTEYHPVQNSCRNAIKKDKSDVGRVSLLLPSCPPNSKSTQTSEASSRFVTGSLLTRRTG